MIKNTPKLTIIIMTYERPNFLEQCLNSILNQNFKNFTILISDNGSIVNYTTVINKFKKKLDLEFIQHKNKNTNSINNFLYCFSKTIKTKYFMVFHDDDIMHKNYLFKSIDYLEKNEKINIISCKSKVFKNKLNKDFYKNYNNYKIKEIQKEDVVIKLICGKINPSFSSYIYRTNAFKKIDITYLIQKYEKRFDRPLLFELLNYSKFAIIDKELIAYRLHEKQDSKEYFNNETYLFELFLSYKKPLKNKLYKFYYYYYFSNNLLYSYFGIKKNNRSNFIIFLVKSYKYKIINLYFPLFLFVSFTHNFLYYRYKSLKKLKKYFIRDLQL